MPLENMYFIAFIVATIIGGLYVYTVLVNKLSVAATAATVGKTVSDFRIEQCEKNITNIYQRLCTMEEVVKSKAVPINE